MNPLQFGENEDLAAYPRDLVADTAAAEAEGVDVLFVPSVRRDVSGADGHHRPRRRAHRGLVRRRPPDALRRRRPRSSPSCSRSSARARAYFGRKDFQQLAVVRRMAADLDLPVQVVGCPLVREPDGVAMSSRNAYLSADERRRATGIFASLRAAAAAVEDGERDPERVRATVEAEAARHGLELEYAEVRRAADLAPLTSVDGEVVVAVAASVGRARLIDNVTMQIAGAEVSTDLGVITLAEQESTS